MFATFDSTLDSEHVTLKGNRPKRGHVQRACDWCRLIRAKCDNNRPCSNCRKAGRGCVSNGQNDFRSMPAAIREIERLRSQIKSLQERQTKQALLPLDTSPRLAPILRTSHERRKSSAEKIQIDSIYYGPSSLPFFLNRLSSFLDNVPGLATTVPNLATIGAGGVLTHSVDQEHFRLPLHQEQYLIDLFWNSYHLYCPIICETEFRIHYKALWANPTGEGYRAASPLVDIILALCIQFSASFMYSSGSPEDKASLEPRNQSLAGLPYFRRCQMLLNNALESPSMTMVQSYIFYIIYLMNSGRLNAAQIMACKAVAMATTLGLNESPPTSESEASRVTMLQTWRSLSMLTAELSIELGRPELTSFSRLSRSSTSELLEASHSPRPQISQGNSDVVMLSLHDRKIVLLGLIYDINRDFASKCDSVGSPVGSTEFYGNGRKREECALYLREQTRLLDGWVHRLPAEHKIHRTSGKPFSTDESPLEFGRTDSVYIQLQRLLLELSYHHHVTNLYRHFIYLSSSPEISTPTSNSNAISSVCHAVRLTSIIHQDITNSNILNGWKQVFMWQKSALFTILGFALTHPLSPYTAKIRQTSQLALEVITLLRATNSGADQVLEAAQASITSLETIMNGFRCSLAGYGSRPSAHSEQSDGITPSEELPEPSLSPADGESQDTDTYLPQSLLPSSEIDALLSTGTDDFSFSEFFESVIGVS